ncbi:kinase-like protein [Eremomyces bilateralis CBS 781.70]|uniref:non-specific serine/threonine protein kinase n=1 Tax=Eremomyces bilateralis CBS 781.70 TaxID=1392243 RepID=A0A6G1G9C7_9PEZI|nr:kinase-like protein [Eremomyces bilateralis CBS 781.70]KAF1814510.1 kinase-like protein [Eremomyces bilateralis CBS 781.70]
MIPSASLLEDEHEHTSSSESSHVPRRPEIQRDISGASTISTSTIRPPRPLSQLYAKDWNGFPIFPDQSYAALQHQVHPTPYPRPYLRTHSSQPFHRPSHTSSASAILRGSEDLLHSIETGSKTVGNSPISSPSLFTPGGSPMRNDFSEIQEGYPSPFLHYTHRQTPRETHVAEKDVDPISGRKIINHYEIIDELGRGVHGKVKLGRDLETDQNVAIKIVERYSKRRRLGKTGSHEDKIKREIAILKKARHSNIVSLLEVIDDPSFKKVYIVLEHVEMGEIKWRTEGEPEITLIEYRRYQRESQGRFEDQAALIEDDRIIEEASRRREREEKRRSQEHEHMKHSLSGPDLWSIEHGAESEDEASSDGAGSRNPVAPPSPLAGERTITGPLSHDGADAAYAEIEGKLQNHHPSSSEFNATGLEGTMYGAYESNFSGRRTPSSLSGASSPVLGLDVGPYVPEHFKYVPLMTLQATRTAFRDTVLGLEYLHYQGVIHRDIKPANLLETKDRRIKISDFGVSYLGREARPPGEDQSESDAPDVDEAIELAKTVGTPAFYAPELCDTDLDTERKPITEQIDVWALGVTLYCLVYGRVPFHDHNAFALMRMIAEQDVYIPRKRLKAVDDRAARGLRPLNSGKRLPHEFEYEDIDDELYDLLRRLFIKDPTRRINLTEVKHHPWILEGIQDAPAWLDETDPSRQTKGKRIEVSKEDVADAVVPLTVVERMRSIVSKIGGAIGVSINRSASSRRRAKSSASGSNADGWPPSATSSSSTITSDYQHGEPSVGFSRTVAGGYLDPPALLRDTSTPTSSAAASPMSSRAPSVAYNEISKQGSSSSLANDRFLPLSFDPEPRPSSRQARQASDERFDKAKEDILRRKVQKENYVRDRPPSRAQAEALNAANPVCPPSPDDHLFLRQSAEGTGPAVALDGASQHTGAGSSSHIPSSSSEDQFTSGMSQSTSHPSMPSVASANSSVPEEEYTVKEVKQNVAPVVQISPMSPSLVVPQSSAPRNTHEEDDGYAPDDYTGDDAVDSDDSDDFLVMSRNHRNKQGLSRSQSVSNAEIARRRTRRATTISSMKTTRSGSNNTMKKIDRQSAIGDEAERQEGELQAEGGS